jgi:hypothetical protein
MRVFIWVLFLVFTAGSVNAEPPGDTPPDPQPFVSHLSPEETLESAQEAFRTGDFGSLRRLLEPLLFPTPVFERQAERIDARQLLGLGLFFDAQQVTDSDERRAFLDLARQNFFELLRERPDFVLDGLLYPASVVELFESVRTAHAQELDALLAAQNGPEEDSVQTIYVERDVSRRSLVLAFFPFGLGQFQNGDSVKGTLFAVGQGLSLGLNLASYLIVESLRGADGYYDPGPDRRSGDYADALTWRNVMYGSLTAFVAIWAGSVVDALLNFEEFDIRIRALDGPPPELLPPGQGSGPETLVPIGWSLQLSF